MVQSFPLFFQLHFYLFGVVSIVSALLFVTRKSPVAAALWLVMTMFALAALYVMLGAEFVGAIQVLVYAGAIMVVFLFVVMLLNLGQASEITDARGKWGKIGAVALGLVLLIELGFLVNTRDDAGAGSAAPMEAYQSTKVGYALPSAGVNDGNAVTAVAQPLFNEYLLAFEVTSVLLLAALVGAVAIGRKRDTRAA